MPTHSETIKASGGGATTATSGSMTGSAGDLWLAAICLFDAGGAVTITADLDGSTSMTQDRNQLLDVPGGNANEEQVALFSLPNVGAGSHSVTFGFGAVSVDSWTLFVMRLAGMATASVADGSGASATGSGTTAASGTLTTTLSDSVRIGVMLSESGANPATVTALDSFVIPTNGSETNGSANVVAGIEYHLTPGTTSADVRMTVSSAAWIMVSQGYKIAAAGGTTIEPGLGSLPLTGYALDAFVAMANDARVVFRKA